MPKNLFYIGNKISSNKPNDLPVGVRIICIRKELPRIEYDDLDGPYENLNQLKKYSRIFKELIKTDPNRVQKILQSSNIIKSQKSIFTDTNKWIKKDFSDALKHTIAGNVKHKKIYGIHFFDVELMKVKKILLQPDDNYIWKAIVEVYSKKRKEWFEKESTFFPIHWTLSQLFEECDYAFQNKVKNGTFLYKSFTKSGIPVRMIIKQGILVTIYPIHNSEI